MAAINSSGERTAPTVDHKQFYILIAFFCMEIMAAGIKLNPALICISPDCLACQIANVKMSPAL